MTQRPFGQESAAPGPFDEPGPGQPDVLSADEESTPEQPVTQHSGTPLVEPDATTSGYADSPYPSGESITETSSSVAYPGQSTTDTDPVTTSGWSSASSGTSSETESKVDTAKGEAKNVADTAKGEARQVADTALGSGKEVAQTAKEEAAHVAAETRQQAASLLDTVRAEVGAQAGTQQNRIADALHRLSRELGSMASSSPESGPLTDLAHQASRQGRRGRRTGCRTGNRPTCWRRSVPTPGDVRARSWLCAA